MKKAAVPLVLLLVLLLFSSAVSAATGTVVVQPTSHGKVVCSAETVEVGHLVVLSVQPDPGYRLVEGGMTLNGQPIYGTTFPMPAGGATIVAAFEPIPLPGWAVALLGVAALALVVLAWVLVARSRKQARLRKSMEEAKARTQRNPKVRGKSAPAKGSPPKRK